MMKRNNVRTVGIAAVAAAFLLAGCNSGGDSPGDAGPATQAVVVSQPATHSTSAAESATHSKPKPKPEPSKHTKSVSPQVSNAIGAAKDYLSFQAFSRRGLIGQLSSKAGDGYPVKVATKAVNSLHVNYKKQAVKAAKAYLDYSSFSKSDLIDQLSSNAGDGYTHDQAVYGANKAYK